MIEKIGAVFLFIIAIFGYGKFKGRQDEKNKQNEENIEQVKSSRKIKSNIEKLDANQRIELYSKLLDNADG